MIGQRRYSADFNYMAIGDSFSSGVGTSAFDRSSRECLRSGYAFPRLLAERLPDLRLRHLACSGAGVADVIVRQVPQLDRRTELVTVTAGGNDVGFTPTLAQCFFGTAAACRWAAGGSSLRARRALPPRLAQLYRGIRAAAPDATVVALGYPRLFAPTGSLGLRIGPERRAAINGVADQLAEVQAQVAESMGIRFVDVRTAFSGHEAGSSTPWINPVRMRALSHSIHPNARGHSRGYLPLLMDALATL
ncbi:lipase 1 [Virgisporangium aliadipatigenens]|uniref:Lipase 1 n=1 Tax=Virgisporangium aliadipatigenens TaxID=741659 RepID=A0A8J3YSN0_9ACTN|nr:SGNH/GDSL hydrolase family protein [Virgisporangium aliadipatigenens]GIJ49145.1 lipase 1 [Virgisporangium aliadipatigenens]